MIDCLTSMNPYVSDIVKSYKNTVIGYLQNAGTSHFLLHIVQCYHACEFDEDNQSLPVVIYSSDMVWNIILVLGFFQSNTMNNEMVFIKKHSTIHHISSKISFISTVFGMVLSCKIIIFEI